MDDTGTESDGEYDDASEEEEEAVYSDGLQVARGTSLFQQFAGKGEPVYWDGLQIGRETSLF